MWCLASSFSESSLAALRRCIAARASGRWFSCRVADDPPPAKLRRPTAPRDAAPARAGSFPDLRSQLNKADSHVMV